MQDLIFVVVLFHFFTAVNLKEKLKPKEIIFTWPTQISAQAPQTGTPRAVSTGQVPAGEGLQRTLLRTWFWDKSPAGQRSEFAN